MRKTSACDRIEDELCVSVWIPNLATKYQRNARNLVNGNSRRSSTGAQVLMCVALKVLAHRVRQSRLAKLGFTHQTNRRTCADMGGRHYVC